MNKTDSPGTTRETVTRLVRHAATGLRGAGNKIRELAQATARGEVKLRLPLEKITLSTEARRHKLERELTGAKEAQAELHRKINDLQSELNQLNR